MTKLIGRKNVLKGAVVLPVVAILVLTSLVIVPMTVALEPQHDVGVIKIISPKSGPSQIYPVFITVKNFGTNTENGVLVNVAIEEFITNPNNGTLIYDKSSYINITAGEYMNVSFPDCNLSELGKYEVTACTQLVGDENSSNNCLNEVIYILQEDKAFFIVHFMEEPDGNPYPFDLIISDGERVQEFNNITNIATEVPRNITFSIAYSGYNYRNMYECCLSLSPFKVYEFEFYALNESSVLGRVQPYISGKQVGATVNLTWEYNTTNNTLIYKVQTDPPDKYAFVTTWFQAASDYGRINETWIVTEAKIKDPKTGDWIEVKYWECTNGADKYIDEFGNTWSTTHTTVPKPPIITPDPHPEPQEVFHSFTEVSSTSSQIGVRKALDTNFWIEHYELTLSPLNGTSSPPQYYYPQWTVLPNNNYIMGINNYNSSKNYADINIPIFVSDQVNNMLTIIDLYPPKIAEIEPYAFSIVGENFFAESSYSNLQHNTSEKILTVDVNTMTDIDDWWGCFVLPKNFAVISLTAYVNETPLQLQRLYDYIINQVGDYNLVVVRIEPDVTSLKLEYIQDNPPDVPDISGPDKGLLNKPYVCTFNSTDSDSDDVYYYIDWGDDSNTGWIGPYPCCTPIEENHTYTKIGTYIIKAKARDIYDLESYWAAHYIRIPKNKAIDMKFLQFLKNLMLSHPYMFPILQKIILRLGLQ
jgi:hypothetical protein